MIIKIDRCAEAGFSLLEVVVCVGILVAGSVVALGTLPGLVRASQQGLMETAAAETGRNAIERVRAAVAYYPSTGRIGNASDTAGHAWAFDPSGTATYVAGAHVHRAFCGTAAGVSDVPMAVTISYDLASDAVRVNVAYPPNPCDPSVQRTVSMSANLAASSWSPQTQLLAPIGDPALQ